MAKSRVASAATYSIFINGIRVGAAQSCTPRQAKTATRVREIGYENRLYRGDVFDFVPGPNNITFDLTNVVLKKRGVLKDQGILALSEQNEGFTIVITSPAGTKSLNNCWIVSHSEEISITGDLIVMETVSIEAAYIS